MGILNSMSEALNARKSKPIRFTTQTQGQNNQPTMASNVANNLNSNSLLMNSAAAKGERLAASRGLQNSTVGIEASQRAMVDAAIPIAQIDTTNAHQKDLTRLQSDLSYNNQSRLNQQQNQFVAGQSALDRTHRTDLTRLQSDLSYNNQNRLNEQQYAHQRGMAELTSTLNHNNAMEELSAQVSANTIGKSIDFTMQIANNFDAQIAGILNNTQMKEKDKATAITQLKASRDSEIEFVNRFMQYIPTTQKDWASFPNLNVPNISIY